MMGDFARRASDTRDAAGRRSVRRGDVFGLRQRLEAMIRQLFDRYRPEKRYMRGPRQCG